MLKDILNKKYNKFKVWEWIMIIIITSPLTIPVIIVGVLPMVIFYPISFLLPRSMVKKNKRFAL